MSRQVTDVVLSKFGMLIALPTALPAFSRALKVGGGSGPDIVLHATGRARTPARCRAWQVEAFLRTRDTGLVGCLPTLSRASNGR